MIPRISVILPTLGRPSLEAALASVVPQLGENDELIVCEDTLRADSKNAFRLFDAARNPDEDLPPDYRLVYASSPSDKWGNGYAQRTHGQKRANGTHLAYLDDDNVFLPGALDAMRDHAADVPVIFRADCPWNGVIWREPKLTYGNVDTGCLLIPNRPHEFGDWVPHLNGTGGDFTFAAGCVDRMGGVEWDEAVVCKLRPHER